MPLQDLTPQLRTRMSRVERAVGFFVVIATILLVAGFAYYVYHVGKRKGWFLTKIYYSTGLANAAGLKVGDEVKLMGFSVGEITRIEANRPEEWYNITIYFWIKKPYYGYLWTDSKVRVAAADFLGHRYLEVIKGREGVPTVFYNDQIPEGVLHHDQIKSLITKKIDPKIAATNQVAAEAAATQEIRRLAFANPDTYYTPYREAKPYWIDPLESPAVTERLETVVSAVENALPGILNLTNQLSTVLDNAGSATERLETLMEQVEPVVKNLALITDNLRDPHGSLGEWILPTNLNTRLDLTLSSATSTLTSVDTNLTRLVDGLDQTIGNLANLTSNLNAQVQVNSNILSTISTAVVDADDLVQGLKRHWLLRSAFKTNKTTRASSRSTAPGKRN